MSQLITKKQFMDKKAEIVAALRASEDTQDFSNLFTVGLDNNDRPVIKSVCAECVVLANVYNYQFVPRMIHGVSPLKRYEPFTLESLALRPPNKDASHDLLSYEYVHDMPLVNMNAVSAELRHKHLKKWEEMRTHHDSRTYLTEEVIEKVTVNRLNDLFMYSFKEIADFIEQGWVD